MAAAAFKSTLTLMKVAGPNKGQRKNITLSASDVNAAALTFPSGGTEVAFSQDPVAIVDWVNSPAYGTDTTTMTMYINGEAQPMSVINAANQVTGISRQFQNSPLVVPAGALVKFVQNT